MSEMLRALPFGFDGFWLCVWLGTIGCVTRRQRVRLALYFGCADAAAAVLGTSLRTLRFAPLEHAHAWLFALVIGTGLAALRWNDEEPASLARRGSLVFALILASIDNFLAGSAGQLALSPWLLGWSTGASFALALFGLEAGVLTRRAVRSLRPGVGS